MALTTDRPDTYAASLALVQPLILRWRRKMCVDGETRIEDEVCPACGGVLRMVKTSWATSLTGNCRTAFCVNFSE